MKQSNLKHQLPSRSFYYARHGQTDWNKEYKLMGQQDILLNEKGIHQAYELAEQVKLVETEAIISSPLLRAHQTAQIIANAINKEIIIIDELKEIHGGCLEGTIKDEETLEYWMLGGTIDGAERWNDFMLRVSVGLHKALTKSVDKPILVVAHGAVYRAIQKILNLEMHAIENCAFILHESMKDNIWKREFVVRKS